MKEKESLYVPHGLKTKTEYFNGFGRDELFKSLIVVAFTSGLNIAYYIWVGNLVVSIVAILVSIAGAVMIFTRDAGNISVADQVKFMVRFSRSTKVYPYQYMDEWGRNGHDR